MSATGNLSTTSFVSPSRIHIWFAGQVGGGKVVRVMKKKKMKEKGKKEKKWPNEIRFGVRVRTGSSVSVCGKSQVLVGWLVCLFLFVCLCPSRQPFPIDSDRL